MISKQHKSTLFRVRLLMLCSQLAIITFVGYWLFGQYEKERLRLINDISNTIANINHDLSDSLMMSKLINSTSQTYYNTKQLMPDVVSSKLGARDSLAARAINKLLPVGKQLRNTAIAYEIRATENMVASVNNIKQMQLRMSTDTILIPDTSQMISAIVGILTSVGDSRRVNGTGFLNTDTITLRKNFSRIAKSNKWNFETIWIYDSANNKIIKNGMFVPGKFMNRNAGVLVKGLFPDIMRKITPQALLGILLVSLAGASFIVSYGSLKKQTLHTVIMKDFISNISHELKTPITTVKVVIEALDNYNAIENKRTTKEYLAIAGAEINRLDTLVNTVLNNTLLEEGVIALKSEVVNIQILVQDSVGLFRFRAEQQGADIITHFEDGNYTIAADAAYLQGVFINIIDNSLKYADKPTVIIINGRRKDKEIEISIADNGPGIAIDYISKVFDRFFRVPVGDVHDIKGHGLGLYYARQIVDKHGGDISVHNNKHSGCTFIIKLPVV